MVEIPFPKYDLGWPHKVTEFHTVVDRVLCCKKL